MHGKTDKNTSGYSQAVWIAYNEVTFHQPGKGKKPCQGKQKTTTKHIVAGYTAKLQIMSLCNPFTKKKLRSTVGTCSLKKDSSDAIIC